MKTQDIETMGMTETRKTTSIYASYSKQGLINLIDKLNVSVSPWKVFFTITGIGALGFINPTLGIYSFLTSTTYGAVDLLPKRKELIAGDIQSLVNTMNNSDNAIIEFKAEFVYSTISDFNANKPSIINLINVVSTSNTKNHLFSDIELKNYLGY